jgi:hypothetical protein
VAGEQQAGTAITFPDPAEYSSIPVYDLLRAVARGHIGLDRRFIQAVLDRGQAALPDLLKVAGERRGEDRVDLEEDLIAIFRHLRTPEALPFFIECIRREPDDIPDDIVEAILPFGGRAIEPLLEVYEEIGEEQGSDLAFLLASLRVRDERILKLLLERLEYDAADGAFCLGLYGDPGAKPALQRLLRDIPQEDLELRREIQFAIEQIDAPLAEASEIAPEPLDIFELYPERAMPPLDVLSEEERLEMLEAGSAELRAEAADSFRNKDLSKEARRRLIGRAKSDPDSNVRGRCWEALGDIAHEDAHVAAAMKAVLADAGRDLVERAGALVGLAGKSEDPDVAQSMRAFYENPQSRAKALEAMWRSFDRQFADYFPRHLDDPDLETKRQAIWGIGYMALGSYAGKLSAMIVDDEQLRPDALFAYSLAVPAEISRGRVRGLFRKIEDVAGGLSQGEADLVQLALDERLAMNGLEPVFSVEGEEQEEPEPEPVPTAKVGRNDPCPCGSGKKYKKCHGA